MLLYMQPSCRIQLEKCYAMMRTRLKVIILLLIAAVNGCILYLYILPLVFLGEALVIASFSTYALKLG